MRYRFAGLGWCGCCSTSNSKSAWSACGSRFPRRGDLVAVAAVGVLLAAVRFLEETVRVAMIEVVAWLSSPLASFARVRFLDGVDTFDRLFFAPSRPLMSCASALGTVAYANTLEKTGGRRQQAFFSTKKKEERNPHARFWIRSRESGSSRSGCCCG